MPRMRRGPRFVSTAFASTFKNQKQLTGHTFSFPPEFMFIPRRSLLNTLENNHLKYLLPCWGNYELNGSPRRPWHFSHMPGLNCLLALFLFATHNKTHIIYHGAPGLRTWCRGRRADSRLCEYFKYCSSVITDLTSLTSNNVRNLWENFIPSSLGRGNVSLLVFLQSLHLVTWQGSVSTVESRVLTMISQWLLFVRSNKLSNRDALHRTLLENIVRCVLCQYFSEGFFVEDAEMRSADGAAAGGMWW